MYSQYTKLNLRQIQPKQRSQPFLHKNTAQSFTLKAQDTDQSKGKQFNLQTQEKQTFKIPDGYLSPILQAGLGQLFRLQSGANNYGYEVKTEFNKPPPPGEYRLKVGPLLVSEKSNVASLKRPEKPLEIYEFEYCPFCRKAREAVHFLDLDVLYRPSLRESKINRPKVKELGGKAQFPYLIDHNTNTQMYESDDIIKYLFNTYGPGEDNIPLSLKLGILTLLTGGLAARKVRGTKYVNAKQPNEPLRFYQYEASPFCKIVREVLQGLELPYLSISTSRGSPKRQQLFEKYGSFQVPYLEDPNNGVALFESNKIIDYLEKTYGKLPEGVE